MHQYLKRCGLEEDSMVKASFASVFSSGQTSPDATAKQEPMTERPAKRQRTH